MGRKFVKCNVCNGTGLLPHSTGEWLLGIISFGILLPKQLKCTTCDGQGYVVEDDEKNREIHNS